MKVLTVHIFPFFLIILFFSCKNKDSDNKVVDVDNALKEFRKNIESNSTLTKQVLDTTSDDQLENKIIANIHSKLDINLSNENEVLPKLSKERQAIYYIYLVEAEVNNGGFD
jgi:hypothetical protein